MRQKLRGRPAEEGSAPEDGSRPVSPLQDRVSETESEGLDTEEDPNAGAMLGPFPPVASVHCRTRCVKRGVRRVGH